MWMVAIASGVAQADLDQPEHKAEAQPPFHARPQRLTRERRRRRHLRPLVPPLPRREDEAVGAEGGGRDRTTTPPIIGSRAVFAFLTVTFASLGCARDIAAMEAFYVEVARVASEPGPPPVSGVGKYMGAFLLDVDLIRPVGPPGGDGAGDDIPALGVDEDVAPLVGEGSARSGV